LGNISPSDVIECRLLFEPTFIALSIANATQNDLAHIQICLESGETADEVMEFEHWDAEFHDAIILSTHNAAAIAMSRLLAQVRQDTTWGKLKASGATPERMKTLKQQHRDIFNALKTRDKHQAFCAMQDHIRYIKHYMFES
jgi:DNA-binding FadR family transcriptional regulator